MPYCSIEWPDIQYGAPMYALISVKNNNNVYSHNLNIANDDPQDIADVLTVINSMDDDRRTDIIEIITRCKDFWNFYHKLEEYHKKFPTIIGTAIYRRQKIAETKRKMSSAQLNKERLYSEMAEYIKNTSMHYDDDSKRFNLRDVSDNDALKTLGFNTLGMVIDFYDRIVHDPNHPCHKEMIRLLRELIETDNCFDTKYKNHEYSWWLHNMGYYWGHDMDRHTEAMIKAGHEALTHEVVQSHFATRISQIDANIENLQTELDDLLKNSV